MAKRIATPKESGGYGYVFENEVAAFFLSHLLSGRPPFDPGFGTISHIKFQTRAGGWFLDDILLILNNNSEIRNFALSVRSRSEFTQKSAPREFVSLAWQQFLQKGKTPFDRKSDFLGLVTTPSVPEAVFDLLEKATSYDPDTLPLRLRQSASKNEISIFNSFACPKSISRKYAKRKLKTGEFLRCIKIFEFNFRKSSPTQLLQATEQCKDMLDSGSNTNATSLWESLLKIANEYRPKGSTLTRNELVSKLKSRFKLKDFPDYRPDLVDLSKHTKQIIATIPGNNG